MKTVDMFDIDVAHRTEALTLPRGATVLKQNSGMLMSLRCLLRESATSPGVHAAP
jgi:hypothetical protein